MHFRCYPRDDIVSAKLGLRKVRLSWNTTGQVLRLIHLGSLGPLGGLGLILEQSPMAGSLVLQMLLPALSPFKVPLGTAPERTISLLWSQDLG